MKISYDKTSYKIRTKFQCKLLSRWRPLFQHNERGIRTLSRDDDGAGKSWRMDVHVQRVFSFLCSRGLAQWMLGVRLQSFKELRNMYHYS